ncbi:MAG: restriction endonuclease subunit S [Candidatus Latescibacteria bacterium]|nr:restriction endonuclease subunit S [Candidatus Latescibacterota bacterium]
MKFAPYNDYKPSGVEWLGDVPAHWEMRRTKSLLKERSQKGFPNEPLLAATQTKGVVRKEHYENRTVLALRDLHLLKLVCSGDFVISLRSFQGGIEYARDRGIISPAYTILYPENPDIHGYLAWLFKSKPYLENLILHVTGIRQGQNIDYGRLCVSKIPLPSLTEQTAIVRYLDQADERIRRYISSRERLIELLEEYRQAVIHHAVTRGLDPDVRLKPSGVEWLGDVPAHWEVRRLRYLVKGKLTYGANAAAEYTDPDWPRYLRITDFDQDGVLKSDTFRSLPPEVAKEYLVQPGDILLARSGAYSGKSILSSRRC